ncbi:Ctr copper transporter family-domain-containing protein [Kockiozyma suomiensis]|uniref:Ctr copper transporter family-domain-containing protein n=1 Tax=Kockiozyma suomiensis TaxID=1337062 RepID=UPI0033441C16
MDHSMHMASLPPEHVGHFTDAVAKESTCKMNMLFTWDYEDLCIIFKWWHIRSGLGFFVSLLAVMGLATGYEFLRIWNSVGIEDSLPGPTGNRPRERSTRNVLLLKSGIYGLQVLYSFFLMLVFMTYNGWVMLAVAAGAFTGHYLWASRLSRPARGLFCH